MGYARRVYGENRKLLYNRHNMAVRPKMQIDISTRAKARAKAVAAEREMTLSELVLTALTKVGDTKLAKLIEEELNNKAGRGRPTNK
jgi:hypothetical protein